MGLISGADEHTISEMGGSRSNEKVIGRNESALSGENREQFSPALGDLGAKMNDRDSRKEGIDLGSATRSTRRCVGQLHAHQQFCVDDGGENDRLIADGG